MSEAGQIPEVQIPGGQIAGGQIADVWRANHTYLVDLAFGMLGDIGAAEDAVQEAFTRLTKASLDDIEDKRGWLIVVTSRICLDQINSARSRHEQARETPPSTWSGRPSSVRQHRWTPPTG